MAATTAAGGVLSTGDLVNEITQKPDKMSDEDLKKIPIYAQFRDAGDDERTARDKYNQLIVGAKPAIAFALGAGEGLFGPVGNIMRGARVQQGRRGGMGSAKRRWKAGLATGRRRWRGGPFRRKPRSKTNTAHGLRPQGNS